MLADLDVSATFVNGGLHGEEVGERDLLRPLGSGNNSVKRKIGVAAEEHEAEVVLDYIDPVFVRGSNMLMIFLLWCELSPRMYF